MTEQNTLKDRYFIQENLDNGLIYTPYVSTNSQLAKYTYQGFEQPCVSNNYYQEGMHSTFTNLRESIGKRVLAFQESYIFREVTNFNLWELQIYIN